MKLSIFVTLQSPDKRQDPYIEAINNYLDFADEVVIVVGDDENNREWIKNLPKNDKLKIVYKYWENDFEWTRIGKQFNFGYESCSGDWIMRADSDYFIHEKDFEDIRAYLETCEAPACTMPKKQFLLAHKFRVKSLTPIAYNKGKYGDRIRLDSGGDACQPSLDGKELVKCSYMQQPKDEYEMPIISSKEYIYLDEKDDKHLARIPMAYRDGNYFVQDRGIHFWNYDFLKKTEHIVKKDFSRFCSAWNKWKGKNEWGDGTEEGSLIFFKDMMSARYKNGSWTVCRLEDHPKYIQETIKNLKPENFGYNLWNMV